MGPDDARKLLNRTRPLRKGGKGAAVRQLQTFLDELGYPVSDEAGRIFSLPKETSVLLMLEPLPGVTAEEWETIDAWEAWKNSEERKAYVAEFEDYYVGEAQYECYSLGLQLD